MVEDVGFVDSYVFVESRELGSAPTLPIVRDQLSRHFESEELDIEGVNSEFIFSFIAKDYFDYIEGEFGVCDKTSPREREIRRKNIITHLSSEIPAGMAYLWCDINSIDGDFFRADLHPGNWYLMRMCFKKSQGFPLVVFGDEEVDDGGHEFLFLNRIEKIPEEKYERLLEIFSLKHIQSINLNFDDSVSSVSGTPNPPILRDAMSIPEEYNEEEYDEFELKKPYYIAPYYTDRNRVIVLWTHNKKKYLTK